MNSIRVYADTSVFGGVFDEEFAEASAAFFDAIREGDFTLVVSALIWEELEEAPIEVKDLFNALGPLAEEIHPDAESIALQRAYLDAGILGPSWETDALHVALATVARCRVIVSWNFKHIVNYRKIPMYNGVNLLRGYAPVGIHTPREVTDDED